VRHIQIAYFLVLYGFLVGFSRDRSQRKAIQYMLRHWKALTLFLRSPGAPLDNNLCERALKKAHPEPQKLAVL
jgi:Transposase IS66 family